MRHFGEFEIPTKNTLLFGNIIQQGNMIRIRKVGIMVYGN